MLTKAEKKNIYIQRETERKKKRGVCVVNNAHVIHREKKQLNKGKVKYVSVNIVSSVDAHTAKEDQYSTVVF